MTYKKIKTKQLSVSLCLSLCLCLSLSLSLCLSPSFSLSFDVIAISESRIKSNMDITTNINTLICLTIKLSRHQHRVMLEEPSYILVIPWLINPRKDLNIYKSHELESTFIII